MTHLDGAAPTLSLVIPCYNEARNLPTLIERCARVANGRSIEIVLVDNGSRDESPAILAAAVQEHRALRSVRVEVNQGYGFGILSGLAAARAARRARAPARRRTPSTRSPAPTP